jgi:hypothetical protein
MGKSFFGHRNGSPDAADVLTPARVAEIGGSIPLSQVQEFRRIPNSLPSVFPPAVVTGLSVATAQSGQLVISWSAPSDNGGSAVTGYILTGTNGTNNNNATSPVTISGLENSVPYTFSVAAVNAIGTGLFSSVVGTSVNSPPAAPTNVVATAGNATATVTWTAPANTGGSAIQSYTVNCSDGQSQTVEGTTATFAVTNGVAITFTVAASNTGGSGPFSSASNSVTPDEPPAGPVFSGVSVNFYTSDNPPFTDAYRTFTATGSGTNTLSFSHAFAQVAGGTYGGGTRVNFTLATAAVVRLGGWQFSGSGYPSNSGINRPCIASASAKDMFGLDKDGIYRLSLGYTYHATAPAAQPMRFALAAGTYYFEYSVLEPSASTFTATLSAKPAYTKTWVNWNDTPTNYQGAGTDTIEIPQRSTAKYLKWTPNNTTTVIRIAIADSVSAQARAVVSYGALTASGRAALLAAGWTFDDKGYTYEKKPISGTFDLSIPPLTSASELLQLHDVNSAFTATILS